MRCSMGEPDSLRFSENEAVSPAEIGILRASVGWNRMENSYRNPAMTSFYHIAVYDGTRLAGYVDSVSNGVTDGYIQDLMVHPAYQGRGIGTALMERMLTALRNKGIYMISVLFEAELQGFYERFGFHMMLAGQLETRWEE